MSNDAYLFGYFETPPILEKILKLNSVDWKNNNFLQLNKDYYLRAKIIPLIGVEWEKSDNEFIENARNLFNSDIINLHNFFLHKFKGGRLSRCVIVALPPRTTISSHSDNESTENNSKRFLIPIITYPEVYYDLGEESKELNANEMWEINKEAKFGLRNYSHSENIHITVDWNIEA